MSSKDLGFHRRPLPACCIAFASEEGKEIFKESLLEGNLEGYFHLSSTFHTQSEPAYCGLGTLTTVLNALNVDPKRKWKGPWRWYAEELLDCCAPLEIVQKQGITMGEFICLARCNGVTVSSFYAQESNLEHFREMIEKATKSNDLHLVVSYDRRGLQQTGSGHFSPIGGYNAKKDLVLILDVARFKYPPHWVKTSLLFEAMKSLDPETSISRGYLLISKKTSSATTASLIGRITSGSVNWSAFVNNIKEDREPLVPPNPESLTATELILLVLQRLNKLLKQHLSEKPWQEVRQLLRSPETSTSSSESSTNSSPCCSSSLSLNSHSPSCTSTSDMKDPDLEVFQAHLDLMEEIRSTRVFKAASNAFSSSYLSASSSSTQEGGTREEEAVIQLDLSLELLSVLLIAFPTLLTKHSSLLKDKPTEKQLLEEILLEIRKQQDTSTNSLLETEIFHWRESIHALMSHCKSENTCCSTHL